MARGMLLMISFIVFQSAVKENIDADSHSTYQISYENIKYLLYIYYRSSIITHNKPLEQARLSIDIFHVENQVKVAAHFTHSVS